MEQRSDSRFLFWTGLATSFAAGLPVWLDLARNPALAATPRYAAWLVGYLVFSLAFAVSADDRSEAWPAPWRWGLLALQSAAGVSIAHLLNSSLTSVLLVVVAAQLRSAMPLPAALVWVGVQTAAFSVAIVRDTGLTAGLTVTGAFLGFQLFALYTSHIAESERQAREELARAHESLLTTRQLLAESTRAAERLRIAQELHDVLGHHLTALALNLEAARHAPEEKARERVETAHRLAKDLLQEVRQVVGALRQEEEAGGGEGGLLEGRIAAALAQLGAGLDEPRVHLSVKVEADGEDSDLVHTLVRCAQEVFTNTVRHAGARNLWLEVEGDGEDLILRARDDGCGASRVVPGNGLQGMRERIERLGGRLEIASAPGDGFAVTAWIPRAGGAA